MCNYHPLSLLHYIGFVPSSTIHVIYYYPDIFSVDIPPASKVSSYVVLLWRYIAARSSSTYSVHKSMKYRIPEST